MDAVRELDTVKDAEARVLEESLERVAGVKVQMQNCSRRKKGLDSKIEDIEKGETQESLKDLRKEDESVEKEIQEMETRLVELRNRQRHVRRRIAEGQNGIEAKVSSFKAAREIVDSQVKVFLARPPEVEGGILSDGFVQLPRGRRTLEMADSHFEDVDKTLQEQKRNVSAEQVALKEGARVWKDAIQEINRFEKKLRSEMQQTNEQSMIMSTITKPVGKDQHNNTKQKENGLVAEMDHVLDNLESKLELAETKNWNLLVCCIGAELEAFREGREVLKGLLGLSLEQDQQRGQGEDEDEDEDEDEGKLERDDWQDPLGVEQASFAEDGGLANEVNTGEGPDTVYERTESEDEDPGPELLISRIESG